MGPTQIRLSWNRFRFKLSFGFLDLIGVNLNLYFLAVAASLTLKLAGAEPPLNCRYSLSSVSAQHSAEGGVYFLRVTASHPQCPWAFAPAPWVHVTAKERSTGNQGSGHQGSMDLMYELQPNFFEQPRVAKLRLESRRDGTALPVATLTVRQQGRGQ